HRIILGNCVISFSNRRHVLAWRTRFRPHQRIPKQAASRSWFGPVKLAPLNPAPALGTPRSQPPTHLGSNGVHSSRSVHFVAASLDQTEWLRLHDSERAAYQSYHFVFCCPGHLVGIPPGRSPSQRLR